ncbi:uncharacterized protein BDW47DRAFT_68688 [Aspergillus candidus]|uniref:Uncharacterized protein n=1 Tax=Aspergillus candidus TaxID=41067 RepID=A0A2I2F3F6_ASPCN|nr:hypothetical protein BDW47DRAFT_68688 [Aspergillus candidus]PLB35118.1 hypothetical protein BDW47DRAFT_68688 [Aspergillus candidus]
MASRQYNMPYNPQDWGPVGVSAGQAAYQQHQTLRVVSHPRHPGTHSDMSLSPPPPPYSPPSQPQAQSQHQQQHQQPQTNHTAQYAASNRGSVSPGAGSTYGGGAHASTEPPVEYRQHAMSRTRPLTIVQDASHPRQMNIPPPPPLPQGIPSSRSSSQNRADPYPEQSSFATSSRPYGVVSPGQHMSPQANGYGHDNSSLFEDLSRPPASRRAVSAGPVVSSAGSSRAASQSRSGSPPEGSGWAPGMPLPPPPPGPPPTSRSQSVNGLQDHSSLRNSPHSSRTARRPPPVLGTTLGSVPPTPADWVDEGRSQSRNRGKAPLNVNTTDLLRSPAGPSTAGSNDPSQANSGLFRSPAIRDPSAKGIRERRIERRNRQSQVIDDFSAVSAQSNSNPWADALDQVKPSDLVLDDQHSTPPHSRSQGPTKFTTPRSTTSTTSDGQLPSTSRSRASSTGLFSNRSAYSTPRAEPSPLGPSRTYAQTPPFSPDETSSSSGPKPASQALPPKALPTPPLHSGQEMGTPSRSGSRGERPVSHLLHLPNEAASSVPPPLSPRRVSSQSSSLDAVVNRDLTFVQNAMQRHKEFIEKEAAASDEAEALKIFADYMIAESQIRRERYTKAWDTGVFDVEGVRQKLFVLPPKPKPAPAPAMPPPPLSRRPSRGAPRLDIPQSRPESAWWNNYQPCLSPIASLGISNDEMSSRGRAPSRWWESHSSSEGGDRRVQRSKRESKYMGLPREALQWAQGGAGGGLADSRHVGATLDAAEPYASYGPDEYPPEKVGWHEEHAASDYSSTVGHGAYLNETPKMDVSRLITLPPPYPRHHPAVNNSHPELVTYRTLVRSVSELSDIKATRQRHQAEVETLRQDHRQRVQEGRRQFKANIQSQIQQGSLTFAEAAEAEAALTVEEHHLERALAQRELDCYQESVMEPNHQVLKDRIQKATACIDELQSKLFDDAQHETPDQTQAEGDEKPELLEKLTQLKWLFEAREQLHRETYDLVSDRDEKYKAVVVLPYQQKKHDDKVRETHAFFIKDGLDRRTNYEASALARLESFHAVIEENVVRGVEMQLSAFWDIAPSLVALVQQIPDLLGGFQIQIPANEYEENPSYHRHPLQYLHSLLSHAEKSSYQYIESQINLFCLLHEVKSAVMRAHCKLMEAERIRQGEAEDSVRREMHESRANEERALTNDLKDKVATVEGQWTEALGSPIQDLRQRVRGQLEAEDGWEDLEQLEQT